MERLGGYFNPNGVDMHQALAYVRTLASTSCPEVGGGWGGWGNRVGGSAASHAQSAHPMQFYDLLCQHDLVNLLFCYRWILLDFKREFKMDEVRCAHTIGPVSHTSSTEISPTFR